MPIIEKKIYRYEPLSNEPLDPETERTWDYIKEKAAAVKNKGFYGEDLDEVNKNLMVAENKDEVIPSLTCNNCHKDLNPEKDKFYDSPEGQFCDNCMIKNEAQQQNLRGL